MRINLLRAANSTSKTRCNMCCFPSYNNISFQPQILKKAGCAKTRAAASWQDRHYFSWCEWFEWGQCSDSYSQNDTYVIMSLGRVWSWMWLNKPREANKRKRNWDGGEMHDWGPRLCSICVERRALLCGCKRLEDLVHAGQAVTWTQWGQLHREGTYDTAHKYDPTRVPQLDQ